MTYYLDRDVHVAQETQTLPAHSCLLVKEDNLNSLRDQEREFRPLITSKAPAADGKEKLVLACED